MVAKSYQTLPTKGEPFEKNGKMYILVIKNNNEKTVRWYTEKEYEKMYGKIQSTTSIIIDKTSKYYRPRREVFGFYDGYINMAYYEEEYNEDLEDYLKLSAARCTTLWGWYFPSNEPIPADLPDKIKIAKLNWNLIAVDDDTLKPDEDIIKIVDGIKYSDIVSNSRFQGSIGERLELNLTIEKAVTNDNPFGSTTTFHIMKDKGDNVYTWATSAKKLVVGQTYTLRGTVKEHKNYRGVEQTVLTRCMIR